MQDRDHTGRKQIKEIALLWLLEFSFGMKTKEHINTRRLPTSK